MLKAALAYARHGWPVFPCHPETKRPLTPKGKDGTGGLKLASIDERVITVWWQRFPKAMIATPTGTAINAFVIDIDAGIDEKTGEVIEADAIIAALEHELGVKLPPTWAVETPRGGRHFYFRLPDGELFGNRAGLIPRVDIRANNGYVVVPPSVRFDGKAYKWIVRPW